MGFFEKLQVFFWKKPRKLLVNWVNLFGDIFNNYYLPTLPWIPPLEYSDRKLLYGK